MTRQEKKEQKARRKEIQKINNSLTYLSKEKQEELNILAIQCDDAVYFRGNDLYKKIYMFHPASLGNKRRAFIKAITDRYDNRIRFTICTKNKSGKISAYMFMTVTFSAPSYYEALGVIKDFEQSLMKDICVFLGISINPCTVENALTYINMNISDELTKVLSDVLFEKRFRNKILKPVTNCGQGFFQTENRYGMAFVGRNFKNDVEEINQFMKMNDGSYYVVVDFQGYTDEDKRLFDIDLRNKYSLQNEAAKPDFVNMTYLLVVMDPDEEKVKAIAKDTFNYFDRKGIQLMAGTGREKYIFLSCASLGLVDFHSMINVSPDMVGGLLL